MAEIRLSSLVRAHVPIEPRSPGPGHGTDPGRVRSAGWGAWSNELSLGRGSRGAMSSGLVLMVVTILVMVAGACVIRGVRTARSLRMVRAAQGVAIGGSEGSASARPLLVLLPRS